MTTQTQASAALHAEVQHMEEMAMARRAQAAADGDLARAGRDIEQAKVARQGAMEAEVLGRENAHERLTEALAALRDGEARQSVAQERADAARRVFDTSKALLKTVRVERLDELAESAEELTAAAIEARDALAGPLQEYMDAYGQASARWKQLRDGLLARVEQIDRERGFDRNSDRTQREASPPEIPIGRDDIAALLSTIPRPLVMRHDYTPDMEPEIFTAGDEPGGERALFNGDPGYQRHTKGGPADPADQSAVPVGWVEPPTARDLELERLHSITES